MATIIIRKPYIVLAFLIVLVCNDALLVQGANSGQGNNNGNGNGNNGNNNNGNGNGNGTNNGNGNNGYNNGNGNNNENGNENNGYEKKDDDTNYEPSTPLASGQEQAVCKSTVCYNKIIVCPKECPERKPVKNKKQKACYINCGRNCEAVCKFRKANCNGYGSLCYDPRFIGGDGVMFYFHGSKGGNFAIVSDENLQINAHFIGTRPKGRTRDYTWVQALAIMFDAHTLVISAKKIPHWDDKIDALSVTFDGEAIDIGEDEWKSKNDNREVIIERADETNNVRVSVEGLVVIAINIRPIGKEENKVHNYQLPENDSFAHLEMQFIKLKNLSDQVEGVLGKTYRPSYVSPAKIGVPMPVMGGEDKYQTPSLYSPVCKVCRFHRPSSIEAIAQI